MNKSDLEVIRLGRISYGDAMKLMQERFEARLRGEVTDALFLLEHEPVLTLGRSADESNILIDRKRLAEQGVEVYHSGRGGDVTYHGPGQLVGYPVIELPKDRRDVRKYVHDIEELMIRVIAEYGIRGGRIDGKIGTWIDESRKIGAIGVRLSKWVTSHGFALNVSTDMQGFELIIPCGLKDLGVTSIERESGQAPTMKEVTDHAERVFREIFY
ncbi:MAG: lipoyl(octanoyl) transferase LipB [Myxococcota bacterium]|nr:lipoyl(octanoyl) transferase LipB [Myxococcota bacterium]